MRIFLFTLLATGALSSSVGQSLRTVSQDVEADLKEATESLAEQRKTIADEKIPMAKKLSELQRSVQKLRAEANRADRLRDSSSLDLNSLEADIKARQDEVEYLNNLLVEYLTSLESRLHPAELPKTPGYFG
jgi:biopolymer transport protein ExbB